MARAKLKKSQSNKRRKGALSVVFPWVRRFGILAAAVTFLLWAGAWVYMIDGHHKAADWARYKMATSMADAGFKVENVLVEGRVHTNADILLALINVQKGDPLFSVEPRSAKALVENMEWVRFAQVERRFPDTLYIQIQERKPMALWKKGETLFLIDEQGEVIHTDRLSRFDHLVFLAGNAAPKQAPHLFESLEQYPEVFERVKAAAWIGDRRWDLQLKAGASVKMPENEIEAAFALLNDAQQSEALLDKAVHSIDLREPERIIIRTKPGEATQYFHKHEASLKSSDAIPGDDI